MATLIGSDQNDVIKGEGGDDRLLGGYGRDAHFGGGFDKDKRVGAAGKDRIGGKQGDDAAAAISDFVWHDLNRIDTLIGQVSAHHSKT